jgi:hypothetical protein
VQRNHESGRIVIVYSLPEGCGFGNTQKSTFCNCDIFTIEYLRDAKRASAGQAHTADRDPAL